MGSNSSADNSDDDQVCGSLWSIIGSDDVAHLIACLISLCSDESFVQTSTSSKRDDNNGAMLKTMTRNIIFKILGNIGAPDVYTLSHHTLSSSPGIV